jgi:hypothetical protein
MMAGGQVAEAAVLHKRGFLGLADLGGVATAWMERQPLGGEIGLGTSPSSTICRPPTGAPAIRTLYPYLASN